MTLKKITAIEEKIKTDPRIDAKIKTDLLDLMRSLKTELAEIKGAHPQTAHTIAAKTAASTKQILTPAVNAESGNIQDNIDGLQRTVEEFEVSHPKLVQIVNRICIMLSDIGI
ncbi:MAG: DUF4404 family protein [Victivallales bacterium]|nr:DUF4404 family protein [Victivallales bacterium]